MEIIVTPAGGRGWPDGAGGIALASVAAVSRIKIGGSGTRPPCNRHGKGEFVLRADGLIDTGWVRPVLFANKASIAEGNKGRV